MTGLLDKVRSAISRDRGPQPSSDNGGEDARGRDATVPAHHSHLNPAHEDETAAAADRKSESRGRQYVSSGRGGAGNISRSRGRQPNPSEPDEALSAIASARSASHSRDRALHPGHEALQSTGRGGAGNVRSPSQVATSRERERKMEEEERSVARRYEEEQRKNGALVGRGRGGMGNISGATKEEEEVHDTLKEETVKV